MKIHTLLLAALSYIHFNFILIAIAVAQMHYVQPCMQTPYDGMPIDATAIIVLKCLVARAQTTSHS